MSKLIVTLTNGSEDKDLVFNIHNTDIASRWMAEVEKNYPLYETERFQGWPQSNKDLDYYKSEILKQINIVNEYKPNTIHGFEKISDQDVLNYLHKFFEDLRGSADQGSEFYKNAPQNVKQAIDMFNVLIHECEHTMRNSDSPTVIVTFGGRERFRLNEEDYNEFTFKWKYGEVYINYCEVGKPLLDVFKDEDEHVGDDNVRPQSYYSADFMIKFGVSTPDVLYNARLGMINEWYKKQNYNFKHLSLGMIPVASLESGKPYPHFTKVKSVCVV